MKGAAYFILFLAASLNAQSRSEDSPTGRLTSALMTLSDAASVTSIREQAVDDVMSMAWKNNQPSRPSVEKFVDALANALVGRELSVTPVSQISIFTAEALHSAQWKDSSFFASLDYLRKALIGLGVREPKAQAVIDSLMDIGFEVRTARFPPSPYLPAKPRP
jgi:acyl carrier protein phosphodiesterase